MESEKKEINPARSVLQYRMPVKGSLIWWLRFLGIVAFLVVLYQLPKFQGVQLARLDLQWLGICMALTILKLLIEAFVWQWLLFQQRIRYAYPKTMNAYLASQYLGLVTPGHVGEFLAAGYISMDTGITMGYALSSVVMKKVLNWLTIMGFGIWGLALMTQVPLMQGIQEIVWMSLAVLAILLTGIFLWTIFFKRLTRKWKKLSPWQIDFTDFRYGMRHLGSVQLIIPLILSIAAYGVLFFQFDALLRAVGISLPFLVIAQVVALSRLASRLIPLSIVGYGSKDLTMVAILVQQGIDISLGVTVTVLFLVCSYLLTLLLSGLCWWVKPLTIQRMVKESS